MTEFYDAASTGNLERVMLLVEQGTEKNKMYNIDMNRYGTYDDYETALAVAAENGHLDVVRVLVNQGADMEMADSVGYTPLINASFNGHLDVVRYLLEQGANRDKAECTGRTPLHVAASVGYLKIAKLLMVYGADLNAKDKNGMLPIDMGHATEEIKQAIRDEPRRRMDEAPGKRATEQDRHPNAAVSAQQENEDKDDQTNLQPGKGGEENDIVADEDQDSEPSDDEDDH